MSSTSLRRDIIHTVNLHLISFGSTPIPDPLALTRAIIESTRLAGTRVLLAPLSHIPAFPISPLPPHAFLLPPDVPASVLLPYTCAVLHAGDAQLTASVLRAGKSSVVVPCVGDQSFWAWALHRAGAAARPVEKGLLFGGGKAKDVRKGVFALKEAIEVALSEQVVENTKVIGDRVRREVSRSLSMDRHIALTLTLFRLAEWHSRWSSFVLSASALVKYAMRPLPGATSGLVESETCSSISRLLSVLTGYHSI